jgi:hypothetical protein
MTKRKPKVIDSIQNELKMLFTEDIPDIALKEPVKGSEFIRKGFVECIDNKGIEHLLNKHKIYVLNEIHVSQTKLEVCCEDGKMHFLDTKFFKGIDYGPFIEGDSVSCAGFADSEQLEGKIINPAELIHLNGIVKSGDETHAVVSWSSYVFKIPNQQLRLRQRYPKLPDNPFKENDVVRCIIGYKSEIFPNWKYTVVAKDRERVLIKERSDRWYPHTHFILDNKSKTKQIRQNRDLKQSIREYLNLHSNEIVSPHDLIEYLKTLKHDVDVNVVINEIRDFARTSFHW